MTENEAIEALRLINTSRVHPFYSWEEMAEVRDIAISALKEIQQYREIGTVEECRKALLKQFIVSDSGRRIPEYDIDNFPITLSIKDVKDIIRKAPTVFDKEKVIEELNEKADYARNRWLNSTKELQTKY